MTDDTLKHANEIKESIDERIANIEHLKEFEKWLILKDKELSLWTLKQGNREIDLWISHNEFLTLYNYELQQINELNEEFKNL